MKRLSDYKGEDAIELWGELLEPVSAILADTKVSDLVKNRNGKSTLQLATDIIKWHKGEIAQIFKIVDPDKEVNGMNVIMRLANVLAEIGTNAELRSFFGFAEQGDMESEFTGSATENTEDGTK